MTPGETREETEEMEEEKGEWREVGGEILGELEIGVEGGNGVPHQHHVGVGAMRGRHLHLPRGLEMKRKIEMRKRRELHLRNQADHLGRPRKISQTLKKTKILFLVTTIIVLFITFCFIFMAKNNAREST